MKKALTLIGTTALLIGCVEGSPTRVLLPDDASLGTFFGPNTGNGFAQAELLEVCKRYVVTSVAVPASTSFNFTSVADPAKNQAFSITSAANNVYACREVWLDGGAGGNVTVVEPALTGFRTSVTRVEDIGGAETTFGPFDNVNTLTGLVSGSGGPNGQPTGQLFLFTNTEEVRLVGCTLTQGYWKTHSSYGPAPTDAGWFTSATPLGPNTLFFSSGRTWYQIFWTPPKGGNAYLQLAHQYMAAKLNILNGASSTTAVDAAILWAEAFFPGKTTATALTDAQIRAARAAAGVLGSYNEGIVGPGHCQDTNGTS